MANVTFSNFKNGLDTRRSELTTQPGALLTLQDAHINEGAEIEKRFAFLKASYVPENSLSLEVTGEGVNPGYLGGTVVFGSGALIATTLSRQNVAGVVTLKVSAANPIYTWVAGDTINVINLEVNANSGLDSYNGNFVLVSATYTTGNPNYYSLVYNVTDVTSETIVTDLNGIVGWGITNVSPPFSNSFNSTSVVSRSVSAGIVTMVLSDPPIYGVINGNSVAIVGASYAECIVPLSLLQVATGYQITFIATANTEQVGDTVYWPGAFTNYVYYQPLVHPAVQDGATFDATYHALIAITASTSFGGFTWTSATFSDGNTFAFWSQNYVPAFRNGIILNGLDTTSVGSNDLIAKQLRNQINTTNLAGFTITTVSTVGGVSSFYLSSPVGETMSIVGNASNTNTGNGTMVSTQIGQGYQTVSGVASNTQFTFNAGSSGYVTGVYTSVDGYTVNLLQASILFTTTLAQLAIDVSNSIATNPNKTVFFTAEANQSTVLLWDKTNSGVTYNGIHVKVVTTGDICVDNIPFNFTGSINPWAVGDYVSTIKWDSTGVNTEILACNLIPAGAQYVAGSYTVLNVIAGVQYAWVKGNATNLTYNGATVISASGNFTPTTSTVVVITGTTGATITSSVTTNQVTFLAADTLALFVQRLALIIQNNGTVYTATAVAGLSSQPVGSYNLYISRRTASSVTDISTQSSAINFTSVAGTVTNGLSGGTTITSARPSVTISPTPLTINPPSQSPVSVNFTASFNGGYAPYNFQWTLVTQPLGGQVYKNNCSIYSVYSSGTTAAGITMAQITLVCGQYPGNPSGLATLTCSIIDSAGNVASKSINFTI